MSHAIAAWGSDLPRIRPRLHIDRSRTPRGGGAQRDKARGIIDRR
jgi:hypothetical protein